MVKTSGLVLICLVSTLTADAQVQVTIGGPVLGFIEDGAGASIWPLLGVSGASVVGQNLELSAGIHSATISPKHDYAIALRDEDGQPVIVGLDGGAGTLAPLAGARRNPDLIGISPTGRAAALYAHESRILQLVTGLPDTGRTTYEFDASGPSGMVGRLTAMAVSDDGRLALLILAEGESAALWVVDAGGGDRKSVV